MPNPLHIDSFVRGRAIVRATLYALASIAALQLVTTVLWLVASGGDEFNYQGVMAWPIAIAGQAPVLLYFALHLLLAYILWCLRAHGVTPWLPALLALTSVVTLEWIVYSTDTIYSWIVGEPIPGAESLQKFIGSLSPSYVVFHWVFLTLQIVCALIVLAGSLGRGRLWIPSVILLASYIYPQFESRIYARLVPMDADFSLQTVYRYAVSQVAAVLYIVAMVWLARDVHKFFRPPEGFCASCHYNLKGVSASTCPECGTPIPTAHPT